MENSEVLAAIEMVSESLTRLGRERPELAGALGKLTAAVAQEAARTPRFANALLSAVAGADTTVPKPKRAPRRAPGIVDPFQIFSDTGEAGLRSRLNELTLEQLRDIVAEHGMDHDRLAMKWKDPGRVVDRILEKVSTRASKGSAFRSAGRSNDNRNSIQ
jgi:hypothetical protein